MKLEELKMYPAPILEEFESGLKLEIKVSI